MKCFECEKDIDERLPHEVTAPDGDCFHAACLPKYIKGRDDFFKNIVHDDDKFADWMGVSRESLR